MPNWKVLKNIMINAGVKADNVGFLLKLTREHHDIAAPESIIEGMERMEGETDYECPICGATVSIMDKECPECGVVFIDEQSEFSEAYKDGVFQLRCPRCGSYKILPTGDIFINDEGKEQVEFQCEACGGGGGEALEV